MNTAEMTAQDVGIAGALLHPLKVIPTDGGPVMHMLRPDSPLLPDCSKGFHTRQTQPFAVPSGLLKIVMYDDRPDSETRGVLCELALGRPEHYGLLRIPVNVWYGFTAMGDAPALICNCADIPHDPTEGLRLPVNDPSIPYQWSEGGA